MPTVVEDGEFRFVVYANDHPPSHVHAKFGGTEVRINLDGGTLMEDLAGGKRRALLEAHPGTPTRFARPGTPSTEVASRCRR